ncbi:non-hydrolyzing UDP-N-acetylglucosamine 2-epimerase [Paracidovorax citrulli]|uniref:non-hydrolyzing UDP-N-acetylglucosamine 2-epimerase n=1 Tax=Paracidovorax citrulli TaxID=80869 RepID=UPI0003150A8C|nr:UDP-N-acetylglucosamine 2-epimerase (non-hydrolyzing) [Paracidovorax citrulli]UEG45563.1 UDP-N-acetylglucosamine 2-epimerase (non-hydrolyzing) [Paracidovorax citrulli]UMT95171.1 UDP-N-acetylglucosamine 2-epimerase (non-hydrolyzing) [Paracidovorax citrulli]
MKKILTVVGARPQFIKAAAISRAISQRHADRFIEVLVHTGQHYDANMSQVFFDELQIPAPKYNMEVSGGGHGVMTGRMLEGVEKIIQEERPDWLLIYGDTNSTLAGALAAAKLHIPIAHVEAGLRSFNMRMPEEINRILSDRVSSLLFCPTAAAVENLRREGLEKGVHNVGDVMYDVALFYREIALQRSEILNRLGVKSGDYVLATCHRAENTDDPGRMSQILEALGRIVETRPVVLPLHPRTRNAIHGYGLGDRLNKIMVTDPLPYLDIVALEQCAHTIVTDSGGVQKEAFFYGVPCVTVRSETEWIETVDSGWNTIAGADARKILDAMDAGRPAASKPEVYGKGDAADRILDIMGADR